MITYVQLNLYFYFIKLMITLLKNQIGCETEFAFVCLSAPVIVFSDPRIILLLVRRPKCTAVATV